MLVLRELEEWKRKSHTDRFSVNDSNTSSTLPASLSHFAANLGHCSISETSMSFKYVCE